MLSIAMTTYNGGKYLSSQLDSILSQTVSDFELIICDDCSTDNTWNLLNQYELKDSRIRIIRNEQNLGFKRNFEKAISLCKGNYIALCDQDDIWEINHLEVLLSNIGDKSLSVGNSIIMNGNGDLTDRTLSDSDNYYIDGDDIDRFYRVMFYGNPFQGTSSMYKKELFEKALPIPDGVEYHDAWFSACACCMDGIAYTYDIITKYRIHGMNASGNHRVTFFDRLIMTLNRKGYKTDRLLFCEELLKRFSIIPNEINEVLLEVQEFYTARSSGNRFKILKILIKNYKKIYSTNSFKLLLPRCFGILLKG